MANAANSKFRPVLFLTLGLCTWGPTLSSQTSAPVKIVTAKQVNGTWEGPGGVFKVWALGKQRLQVEFSVWYKLWRNSQIGIDMIRVAKEPWKSSITLSWSELMAISSCRAQHRWVGRSTRTLPQPGRCLCDPLLPQSFWNSRLLSPRRFGNAG